MVEVFKVFFVNVIGLIFKVFFVNVNGLIFDLTKLVPVLFFAHQFYSHKKVTTLCQG